MNIKKLSVITSFLIIHIFLSSCAAKLGIVSDIDNYSRTLKHSTITNSSFIINHQSALSKVLGPSFGALGGLIGGLVDKSKSKNAQVNQEAFLEMQNILSNSKLFQYKINDFKDAYKKYSKAGNEKIIQQKGLDNLLIVEINLALKSTGMVSGKIIAQGRWRIIDAYGKEKVDIRTLIEDEEIFSDYSWNPSTSDPKHKEKIVRLVKDSTISFLSYLNGNR